MTTEELKAWAWLAKDNEDNRHRSGPLMLDAQLIADVGKSILRLIAERDALLLAAGDYHLQRGAPSWKPQCQIDLEVARDRAATAEQLSADYAEKLAAKDDDAWEWQRRALAAEATAQGHDKLISDLLRDCDDYKARALAAEARVKALEKIILDAGLWRKAPCCLCGYNGPGYFQDATHKCAALAGEGKP